MWGNHSCVTDEEGWSMLENIQVWPISVSVQWQIEDCLWHPVISGIIMNPLPTVILAKMCAFCILSPLSYWLKCVLSVYSPVILSIMSNFCFHFVILVKVSDFSHLSPPPFLVIQDIVGAFFFSITCPKPFTTFSTNDIISVYKSLIMQPDLKWSINWQVYVY